MTIPELIVVGAGPGDPELITIKAHKALMAADVVLYDNLANRALLAICKPECEKIYVGKLPYGEFTPQENIHTLIKEKALSKGKVVRLKGGDPFIFGRGFEEILYARSEGITASYIPGITSMQAAGFEDVPLTHRNVSEGFWVMTGTKKDGSLTSDLLLAMQSKATVVIYMGMKHLDTISAAYCQHGLEDMPAIVVQYASLSEKKVVKGTIKELPALVEQYQLSHPAVIIIGQVAGLNKNEI